MSKYRENVYEIRGTDAFWQRFSDNPDSTRLYPLDLTDLHDAPLTYYYKDIPSMLERLFEEYKDVPMFHGDKHTMCVYFYIEKTVLDNVNGQSEPIDWTDYRIEVGKNGKFKLSNVGKSML